MTDYSFELRRSCFCGPDFTRRIRIDVESGSVIGAVYVDDGQPVTTPLGELSTIEDLFDEIQNAIDREAFTLLAEYEPVFGHPTEVSIDFDIQIADEEMAFDVRNLVFAVAG